MSALKPTELSSKLAGTPPPLVIDLRSPEEFAAGSIPGAKNLPWSPECAEQIAARVPRATGVVFICAWGHRSAVATIALRREGFRHVAYLEGGLEAWGLAGFSLERSAASSPPSLPAS